MVYLNSLVRRAAGTLRGLNKLRLLLRRRLGRNRHRATRRGDHGPLIDVGDLLPVLLHHRVARHRLLLLWLRRLHHLLRGLPPHKLPLLRWRCGDARQHDRLLLLPVVGEPLRLLLLRWLPVDDGLLDSIDLHKLLLHRELRRRCRLELLRMPLQVLLLLHLGKLIGWNLQLRLLHFALQLLNHTVID